MEGLQRRHILATRIVRADGAAPFYEGDWDTVDGVSEWGREAVRQGRETRCGVNGQEGDFAEEAVA